MRELFAVVHEGWHHACKDCPGVRDDLVFEHHDAYDGVASSTEKIDGKTSRFYVLTSAFVDQISLRCNGLEPGN
jgi:hypothetical protein